MTSLLEAMGTGRPHMDGVGCCSEESLQEIIWGKIL